LPQTPQFDASFCELTHAPPQTFGSAAGQAQTPFAHEPLVAHALDVATVEQAPQFTLSVFRS